MVNVTLKHENETTDEVKMNWPENRLFWPSAVMYGGRVFVRDFECEDHPVFRERV